MSAVRIVAILLILAGGFGLAYGSFTYTKDTHKTTVGPLELSVKDTQTIDVPTWAGVGLIVIGVGLLAVSGRKG